MPEGGVPCLLSQPTKESKTMIMSFAEFELHKKKEHEVKEKNSELKRKIVKYHYQDPTCTNYGSPLILASRKLHFNRFHRWKLKCLGNFVISFEFYICQIATKK